MTYNFKGGTKDRQCKTNLSSRICQHCQQPIYYRLGKGWVHGNGSNAGYRERTPDELERFQRTFGRQPNCYEWVVEDHLAQPSEE